MSESTNSIPMPIPESPHSVQTPRSSSRGNSTDSALPSPDLHRREAISGASLTSVKSFETAAESTGKRRSALSERGIEQAGSMNENVESSAHKRPTSMIEDSQRGAFSGLSEAEATLDEEIDPEQSIRLIPHSGASDNGEAITPTDINALELMPSSDGSTYYGSNVSRSGTGLETITEGTHSREPSTVSSPPLVPPKLAASREPSPGPSVGSSGRYLLDRRGSRHSVQSLPTHSLSGPSGYASNNGPQATLSSVSSVRNPSSTDTSSIGGDETAEGLEERAKELAQRCWVEDESFLRKEKVAEWLGGV